LRDPFDIPHVCRTLSFSPLFTSTPLVTSSILGASAEEPLWSLGSLDKAFQEQEEQEDESLLLAASKAYEKACLPPVALPVALPVATVEPFSWPSRFVYEELTPPGPVAPPPRQQPQVLKSYAAATADTAAATSSSYTWYKETSL
jgi:hypothetical protein